MNLKNVGGDLIVFDAKSSGVNNQERDDAPTFDLEKALYEIDFAPMFDKHTIELR